ncbi:MAG: LysR family transcriptional regulator [Rubritepida sp.]|nr:LysR family transcriptional regulator [Rubritepida sp.]
MPNATRRILSEKQRLSLASRIDSLDNRRLLYLHEAAAAGSVRGGAERLGISPSALSRQIMKMEADLQIALLERHGRGVKPTEAGALLAEYFEDQRARLGAVVAQVQDIAGMRRGIVSLALGEGFLGEVMGAPLKSFAARHPQLQIDLQVGSTDELMRRVLEDTAQIALLYNLPSEPRVQSHASRRHPMRIVTQPAHPLALLGRKITLDDLQQHELGLLPGGYGVRQVLLSAEHRGRLRLMPRLTANSLRALLRFAEDWDGVLITTGFAVARELEEGRLVALEAHDAFLESSEAHLITRRGRRLPLAATHLLRHLRATMKLFRG